MGRLTRIGFFALACFLSVISTASADEVRTDANIVTALDISDSVDPELLSVAIKGMARALRAPGVLQAIQSGRYGRIGFAFFAWYHGGAYPELVSWTPIASETDVLHVSSQIAHWTRLADEAASRRQNMPHDSGRLTDISEAIEHATELFLAAPYATQRQVLNVIGNGEDNLGENPEHARDRFVSRGGNINGVVLGNEAAVLEYYRRYVVGGSGAFCLSANDAGTIAELLELKLRYDLAMNAKLSLGLARRAR